MNVTYVQDLTALASAREEILAGTGAIGCDTETTGFDPLTEELRLLQVATSPERVIIFNLRELNDPSDFEFFRDILASRRPVCFQNAKFDLQFLTHWFDQGPLPIESLYDTMLVSKLIACGDPQQRHGLADIARRELEVTLDKTLQKSDFGATDLSEEQLFYAAKDSAILLDIRDAQKKKLAGLQLERVARIECDAVAAIADVELNGIYMDGPAWATRVEAQALRASELHTAIMAMIKPIAPVVDLFGDPVVNIDSPQQIGPILQRLGVRIGASTKEMELLPFKGHPLVDLLLDYREMATALKKFGSDYLGFIHEVTGRIHADFHQLTAPSGRMSVSKPGLQQLPREAEYRSCFKAQGSEGKIIKADYSQVELRIMAKQSGDPALIKAFKEGKDLHTYTASLVFNEPYDNVDPEHRRISKNLNFGTAYGVGPPRFAEQAGVTVDAAEVMLRNFWGVYGVLDAYLKRQGSLAGDQGYARTSSGRMMRVQVDHEDRQAYAAAKRLGRNFGVQGTGADILKRALYLLRNSLIGRGLHAKLVNIVHDEIVVEALSDADTVAETVKEAMVAAGDEFLAPIPCNVDVKIGDSW